MDLKNNQITISEILQNPKAKAILARNFPELMHPFILQVARKMNLENTLKLAKGNYSSDNVSKIISDLELV